MLPSHNIAAMNLHLVAISAMASPGRHAVPLCSTGPDGIYSSKVAVPENITLLALPPKCPEMNTMGNAWQFIRDNWLSNRVFCGQDDIIGHCRHAWDNLADQPWRIMSIGLRNRARRR